MYVAAAKDQQGWHLTNSFGHQLTLPCHAAYSGQTVPIGVLGTGTRIPLRLQTVQNKHETKTEKMAAMLGSLNQPLYLLDTRRNGVGGQGSWAPLEFATLIPTLLEASGSRHPYAYVHLPCLAPPVELLRAYKAGAIHSYHQFVDSYRQGLIPDVLDVGRAFVEAATSAGGLAIFLCAEADQPAFATLAEHVAQRIIGAYAQVDVRIVHLDLVDYAAQSAAYVPRFTQC